jgi:hypothetical protein
MQRLEVSGAVRNIYIYIYIYIYMSLGVKGLNVGTYNKLKRVIAKERGIFLII